MKIVLDIDYFGKSEAWYNHAHARHTLRYKKFFEFTPMQNQTEKQQRRSLELEVNQWNAAEPDENDVTTWLKKQQEFHKSYVQHCKHAGEKEVLRRAKNLNIYRDSDLQPYTSAKTLVEAFVTSPTLQKLFRDDPNQFFSVTYYLFRSLNNSDGEEWLEPAVKVFFDANNISMSNVKCTSQRKHSAISLMKYINRIYIEKIGLAEMNGYYCKLLLYARKEIKDKAFRFEIDVPLYGGKMNPNNHSTQTKRFTIEVYDVSKCTIFANYIIAAAQYARQEVDNKPVLDREEFLRVAAMCYDDLDGAKTKSTVAEMMNCSAKQYGEDLAAKAEHNQLNLRGVSENSASTTPHRNFPTEEEALDSNNVYTFSCSEEKGTSQLDHVETDGTKMALDFGEQNDDEGKVASADDRNESDVGDGDSGGSNVSRPVGHINADAGSNLTQPSSISGSTNTNLRSTHRNGQTMPMLSTPVSPSILIEHARTALIMDSTVSSKFIHFVFFVCQMMKVFLNC